MVCSTTKLTGRTRKLSPLTFKTEHLQGVMILISTPQQFCTLQLMKITAKCLIFLLNNIKILIMIKAQFLNKE